MAHEVKIPEVGESISEGTLTEWFVEDGQMATAEEALFELETDKVTMEVVAEVSGKLTQKIEAGELVEVGQVVGEIDEAAKGDAAKKPEAKAEGAGESETEEKKAESAPAKENETSADKGNDALAPAVRRMVEEHGLNPDEIPATGKDGRLTKEDVVQFMEAKKAEPAKKPQAKPAAEKPAPKPKQPMKPAVKREEGQRQTRTPMTRLRKRIAERLVEAQHNAAMLTTFNEVDMTNLMAMRKSHQDAFVKKYGLKLGMMSFFVKASVDALQTLPQMNAAIDGDDIVENHFYDIGIAVGSDRGLVVPVIKDCDALNFAEIEMEIADKAKRVKNKTITLDELTGGVFTITNGGVYGSLLSTPILNPPQSAILGMHGIKKRPVVVGDEIVARPMMYLALSYDHRIVDGKDAVTFLRRIVDCVENPERMLLEV